MLVLNDGLSYLSPTTLENFFHPIFSTMTENDAGTETNTKTSSAGADKKLVFSFPLCPNTNSRMHLYTALP